MDCEEQHPAIPFPFSGVSQAETHPRIVGLNCTILGSMAFSSEGLIRFWRSPWHDKVNRLHAAGMRLKTELYYRRVLGGLGKGCVIYTPMLLANPQFVSIGDYTLIRPGARIEVIVLDEARPPSLVIGSNVNIEQNVHIVCSSSVFIGDNVSIAPSCGILDTSHPYFEVDESRKIGSRVNLSPTPVEIGSNSLLGHGVVVLPGVHIGKNCVIGANSTVIRDVPDCAMAAGSPAAVLKRYDSERKAWIRLRDE